MNNYILGLDLGITSVGFGIIDKDTLEIIKYGVRLFEESNADNNVTRRTKRSQRRTIRRRQQRVLEARRLIFKDIITKSEFKILNNVYELRVKGLNNKLTNNELANVLINIAKKRGSSLEVVIDESDKENLALAGSLTKNSKRLLDENKFICELQLEDLKTNSKIKGSENIFKTEDYIKELKQILSNQSLNVEFNEKIISIIERRRHFAEGPGDENSPTIYGRYKGEIDVNGNKIIHNLLDLMRGKCSVYPDEKRCAKNSFKAYLFNLLNDLNNLTIVRSGIKTKITIGEKEKVIDIIKNTGKISIKDLLKILNATKDEVSGFRITKKGEPQLTKFEMYEKFIKIQKNFKCDDILNLDFYNNTIDVLTKTQIEEERFTEITNKSTDLNLQISENVILEICKLARVNGYHALSEKAIDEISKEMLLDSVNQQQVLANSNITNNHNVDSSFDIKCDKRLILSPVAKRVQAEAIKVVNELRKEYGEFNTIMIETTRSKNSKEERELITKLQKNKEQNNLTAVSLAQENNVPLEKLNGIKKLKLKLYNEQGGKCIYTGNPIDINTLLNDDTAYEIEHIIPYSISFDNSLNNKALSESTANRLKGNNTPFYYFKSGQSYGVINSYDTFKTYIENLPISRMKKTNLLNEENITKYSNQKDFINRNLVDTSYGIRSFMNTIAIHYKTNEINTVVRTTKGKITNMFRGVGKIDENGIKDRNYLIHHAIDALIVAGVGAQKAVRNAYAITETVDDVTGEVFESPIDDSNIRKFLKELKYLNSSEKVRNNHLLFSYKVDTKVGRQVSDETIYSTRIVDDNELVVKKYKNIYGKEGESLTKLFADGTAEEKILMFKNDNETFNLLKDVYESYKDAKDSKGNNIKNVFEYYYSISKEKIRKYSKKNNGPEITSIKYYDGKLGNHISLTKNYETKNKNVVLLQISPYRTDFYKDSNGLYKFVTIRRKDIISCKNGMHIKQEVYKQLKVNKGIDESFKFQFSLNRNNIVRIVSESSDQTYRFIGTNNDNTGMIELKNIHNSSSEKRIMSTIGKKITLLEKYNVSPIGKWKKVIKEDLKLTF